MKTDFSKPSDDATKTPRYTTSELTGLLAGKTISKVRCDINGWQSGFEFTDGSIVAMDAMDDCVQITYMAAIK